MTQRPHGRKRNDTGQTAEVKKRGEGLGGGPSGNAGYNRGDNNNNNKGNNPFGDSFDLGDLMDMLRGRDSGTRAGGAGSSFDLGDLLNALQSGNTHVTNNNNIDINDLINLLQQNQNVSNNNNVSLNSLFNALGGQQSSQHSQNSFLGNSHSGSTASNSSHVSPVNHSQSFPSGSASSGGGYSGRKRGPNLLMIILLLVAAFFLFKMLFGGSGQSAVNPTPTPTPAATPTPTPAPTPTPQSGNTGWNFGSAITNNVSYANTSYNAVNTASVSGIRDKYTKILGNGNDTVTMLVYMCATDLESKYGMGTADISEMASAVHSDKVNIILETGGTKAWKNNVMTAGTNQRWQILDNKQIASLGNVGKKAMTDESTLADFINWGVKNYPANRYFLVLWDHGGGSMSGYGYDELYPNGSMTVDRVASAIKSTGVKFDIIGFDACLMQNAETAFALTPYADYLIGSEETEPGTGWAYTNWLSSLAKNTSMPSLDIGKMIIDDFVNGNQQGASANDKNTLSIVDLAEFEYVFPQAISDFARSINQTISSNNYQTVADARSVSKEFAQSQALDQIDLIHFANTLGSQEGKKLISALQSCIKYNRTSRTVKNAYGMSIYFPYRNSKYLNSMLKIYSRLGFDSNYSSAVKAFGNLQASGQIYANSTSNSLYDLFGGSTVSNGSSFDLSSFLGGSGSYGGYDLSSLLGGSEAVDTSSLDLLQALFGRGHLDSSELVLSDKNGRKVLSLSEDDWAQVQSVNLNVWVKDEDGYIDLGLDNIYDFDEDGDLIIDYDGKWMTLNGEVVAVYTMTNEWATDTDYSMMYYIPARINGEDANIIIDYSSQNELGAVLGYEKIYETNVDSKMIPFAEGDKIDLVCDHYDNKGNFEDRYLMGSTITVGSDLKLELGDATLSNTDLLYGYRLVDIYNAERYTPMVEY